MECRATDVTGEVHVFTDDFARSGEALGALFQWWADVASRHTIVSVTSDPASAVLPYYGQADVAELLLAISPRTPPQSSRRL